MTAASILAEVREAQRLAAEAGLHRFADALLMMLQDGIPLDRALGLPSTWRVDDRARQRAQILRHMAARYWPDLRGRELAREITKRVGRYEAAACRHGSLDRPAGIEGDIHDLLRLGPAPCDKTIRNALRDIAG